MSIRFWDDVNDVMMFLVQQVEQEHHGDLKMLLLPLLSSSLLFEMEWVDEHDENDEIENIVLDYFDASIYHSVYYYYMFDRAEVAKDHLNNWCY